MVDEQKQYTW